MRKFFKEYLNGTAPLWKSFWLLWLGGISALTLVAITGFMLSIKYLHSGITWYGVGPAFLLLLAAYSFFCWVAVWRCSQNSRWRGWRFISKAVVITVIGAYLFASYSVFNLYNNKPAVTADEPSERLTGKTTEETASAAIQIGWVGLWNSEMIGWVENINRISRICPDSMPESDKKRCLEASLAVKTWTIPVHKEPSSQSRRIGSIMIYVKPGESFKLAYKSGDSNNEISFQPDVFDPDWGYGPYLHQTFQDENSGWFLLPKDPLGETGWINAGKLADNNKISVLAVKEGGIYKMENVNIVIEKIDPDKIVFRPEQAVDMWCEADEAPEMKKVTPSSLPIKKIYDANGHLKLKPAYTRGC